MGQIAKVQIGNGREKELVIVSTLDCPFLYILVLKMRLSLVKFISLQLCAIMDTSMTIKLLMIGTLNFHVSTKVKNRSLPLSLHGNFGKDTSPKVKNFMKLGLEGSLAKVS